MRSLVRKRTRILSAPYDAYRGLVVRHKPGRDQEFIGFLVIMGLVTVSRVYGINEHDALTAMAKDVA